MIAALSYEEMIKILASFLDQNSGIEPERILNADSIRGIDLSQFISDSQIYSIEASKPFLQFEVLEDVNGDHFLTSGESADTMTSIQSYELHLMIYGNQSPSAAQKIAMVFKNGKNASYLRENGIFVTGVDAISPMNEFVNDTWIMRRDLVIRYQSRIELSEFEAEGYFIEEIPDIIAKRVP